MIVHIVSVSVRSACSDEDTLLFTRPDGAALSFDDVRIAPTSLASEEGFDTYQLTFGDGTATGSQFILVRGVTDPAIFNESNVQVVDRSTVHAARVLGVHQIEANLDALRTYALS